ncbi:MAG: YvcK family protein [Armatimonadetes bacterium]|nr:YvcK family protein [Armatimonadota bacterium]
MRVKRWLLLVPVGLAIIVLGVGVFTNMRLFDYMQILNELARQAFLRFGIELYMPSVYVPFAIACVLIGLLLVFISIKQIVGSITSAVASVDKGRLADVVFQKRYLAQGYRLVTIGGGTGLSTLLRGLKSYTSNITAIVTVTDDGGSSGALTRQFGMLPPGDIRNCLVALADSETLMTELLQYRFNGSNPPSGVSLEGHSFGNLLLMAMTNVTGDFELAVKETSRVLAIRGSVLPSTTQSVSLLAEMETGELVEGETNILHHPSPIHNIYLNPPQVKPLQEAMEAIKAADAIILGPGSVYTSIVPNLLVEGIAEALHDARALKIYVCNVMTQPGETDGFTASDHVRALQRHAHTSIFDYVLMNNEEPSPELLERYRTTGAELVRADVDVVKSMGYHPIVANLISQTDVVRHSPDDLAAALMRLVFDRGGMRS